MISLEEADLSQYVTRKIATPEAPSLYERVPPLSASSLVAEITEAEATAVGGSLPTADSPFTGLSDAPAPVPVVPAQPQPVVRKFTFDEAADGDAVNDKTLRLTGELEPDAMIDLTRPVDRDQVGTKDNNGDFVADNVLQKHFEHVDLSEVTGDHGATIIARTVAEGDLGSTIIGSKNADIITGGAGVDTITGGAGGDDITGNVDDIMDGGAGFDILYLTGALAVDTEIDLRKTGDQDQVSGDADQRDFESVDLSGVTAGFSTTITAHTDGSTITGSKNADTINGGAGDDTLRVTGDLAANTVINIGRRFDLNGEKSNFENIDLSGITGDNGTTIRGSAGNNHIITGSKNDDRITGNSGNDTLNGLAGNDTIIGGAGNDVIHGIAGNGGINGSPNSDVIYGKGGDDIIYAGGRNGPVSIYYGGAGNDTIHVHYLSFSFGGAKLGRHSSDAGLYAGNDTLVLQSAPLNKVLWIDFDLPQQVGFDNNGVFSRPHSVANQHKGYENIDLSQIPHGYPHGAKIFALSAGSIITGSSKNDTITGRGGNDTINGGGGVDTITGGGGNDTIDVSDAKDIIDAGAGNDTLILTGDIAADIMINLDNVADQVGTKAGGGAFVPGANAQKGFEIVDLSGVTSANGVTITAHRSGSTITGSKNDDIITGGAGNDTLRVTGDLAANTVINIGRRFDLNGEKSNFENIDLSGVTGTNGATIQGSAGNDHIITGSKNDDRITGNSGNDTLNGLAGNDTIIGGAGINTLIGGEGNDTIAGGQDSDTITGSAGNDIFFYMAYNENNNLNLDGHGQDQGTDLDTIMDYTAGEDKLRFVNDTAKMAAGAAGGITIAASGEITVFGAAATDSDKKIAAIEADARFNTAKKIVFFIDSGDTYIYHTGESGYQSDDMVVKLENFVANSMTITGTSMPGFRGTTVDMEDVAFIA